MAAVQQSNTACIGGGTERRHTTRRRMLKPGRIVSLNKFFTFDCVIRNLSSTGALLVVASATEIPNEFDLAPGSHDRLIRCRVAWRDTKRLGVEFLSDPGSIHAN